jgi:hypothetical protein
LQDAPAHDGVPRIDAQNDHPTAPFPSMPIDIYFIISYNLIFMITNCFINFTIL